jgi:hypothetical protein
MRSISRMLQQAGLAQSVFRWPWRFPYPGIRLNLVALGLLLLLSLAVPAQAQEGGMLEGQVVNGTAGGPDVGAGVAITLHVLRGTTEVDTLETTTDADGRFYFEGLDTDPTLAFWVEAVYLDVSYSNAEVVQFASDQGVLELTVAVYETTEDDSTVVLDSVHIIAQSFGQVLRITEIHLFGNNGDRTYVGRVDDNGQRTTVYIPLPESAVGLAFELEPSQDRFVDLQGGVMDTEPVPPAPNASQVVFSYHLMVTADSIPLERRFAYPVSSLSALIAQPGLMLDADQMQSMGTEFFEDQQYEFFTSPGLAADTPLTLELLPVPGAGTQGDSSASASLAGLPSRGNQELLRWFGYVLAGLAVLGAVIYTLTTAPSRPVRTPALKLTENAKARKLLAGLADLEDAYEAGQVDEATYERQRAEEYEALKSL